MTTRNKYHWVEPSVQDGPPPEALLSLVDHHPLLARLLVQRGFTSADAARAFLSPQHYTPAPPAVLPDLEYAAQRLEHAIAIGEKILVWGDFDVDGQTSTALLVDALKGLGAEVGYYIPHRLRESHGIQLASLQQQIAAVNPGVLLTCDTGVSAHTSIDYAKSQGITTLITDHHDLPPALPNADAVIDPKRLSPDHPLASLPGVGVAYKLIQQLYTGQQRAGELPRFLDLVALGIVADVAQQTHDTRYLLQLGMHQLRHTRRTGLHALFEIAGLNPDHLTTEDVAFQIGPRLNAAGRLDDARPVVDLFTTTDESRAHVLALQLEGLNNQRRLQNRQIYAAAQELIARDPSLLDWEALVLAHPGWHAGIIGIVASRLAEVYQRPVVMLSTDNDGLARGSARSAPGYDIGAAIAAQAELLIQHGGHPGAAGLSMHADNIPAFRRRLSDTLHETRDRDVHPGITIDAFVTLDRVSLELATDLRRLAPFGEGNPQITLATCDLTLKSAAFIGRTRDHRRLVIEDAAGTRHSVLWWNSADQPLPEGSFDLAYRIDISTYGGSPELQLTFVDYRRAASAPPAIEPVRRTIIDRRAEPDPAALLKTLQSEYPHAAIWAEGYRRSESPGVPLADLPPAPTLIVYTTPATPQALQEALERVEPQVIILLAINPPIAGLAPVLRRSIELVKFVINRQEGRTTLTALAGAVGQSRVTIERALDYLAARGEITVAYSERDDSVVLVAGDGVTLPEHDTFLEAFRASAAETAAYRAYFQRADAHRLLGEQPES